MEPDVNVPTESIIEQLHVGGIVGALIVIAITWFAVQLLSGFFTRLSRQFADKRIVINQAATALRFIAWSFGCVIGVVALDLSKEFMLTLTGAAAVTIGFALKDLAASVLAGITILIDRPFQVGDRVSFGGFYGEISEIGLRSVRLVTLDDNLVTIPNNKFLTDLTSSGNAGALDMLVQVDFFIGIDQDLSHAKRTLEECVIGNPYCYTKKPWTVLVSQVIHDHYIAYRLRTKAYVLDVQYEKAYETELTERVHEAFRRESIAPPAVLLRTERGREEAPRVSAG